MYPNSRFEKAHFIVYSNEAAPFGENSDYYCESALRAGFDTATHHTERQLRQTPFWEENRAILEQPRGAGYWLWKPWIILETLRKVGPNDIVVYNDAGRYSPRSFEPFPSFPHAAVELTAMMPKRFIMGTRIEWLVQGQYTKRDCMILTGADTDEMRYAPQINACPALFMPSAESFAFLERWLELARDPRALTDQPDELGTPHPEFEDHRHDMAIASILLHQTGGHYFDLSETGALAEADHLRQRNRHVPRLQTHIGYLSLIAREALRDDFFADPQADLSEVERLVRNIRPDEPIPQQPRTVPARVLVEELNAGTGDILPDHVRAAAQKKAVTAMKIHALGQQQEGTDMVWADAAAILRNVLSDGAAKDPDALAISAAIALDEALSRHPDLQRATRADMVWNALGDEARAMFKARFKRNSSPAGRAALEGAADHAARAGVFGLDRELSYPRRRMVAEIEGMFTDWLRLQDAEVTE